MAVMTVMFAVMAYFYKYVNNDSKFFDHDIGSDVQELTHSAEPMATEDSVAAEPK